MLIANPIYDVVFKYLMEDSKIAKLMISSIINEEIESLEFLPQEFTMNLGIGDSDNTRRRTNSLTVYRLDFSAIIITPEGKKNVIIELQKAKYPTDIMRFRTYLGNQYLNSEHFEEKIINGKYRKVGIPIITIYFLGHKLDYTDAPIIKVGRTYFDMFNNQIIDTKEAFIESLTNDSYIIQIPYLKDKRRNDLEILLSVFDQSTKYDVQYHLLSISEEDFPEKYRPIIRKLQAAAGDHQMKNQMILEDGIIRELEDLDRRLEIASLEISDSHKEIEKISREKSIIELENEKIQKELGLLKAELEKLKLSSKENNN